MAENYPIMLNIEGKACVVIGGGDVAARKIGGLLDAQANVTVISPQITPAIHSRLDAIKWVQSVYQTGMLEAYQPFLVFAATNDPDINNQITSEAHQLGALVNQADDASSADFQNVVTLDRSPLKIMISTGGASPALAKHLKQIINHVVGNEYAVLAQWLQELRPVASVRLNTQPDRQKLYETILASDILMLLRQQKIDQAYAQFQHLTQAVRQST